ncbi:hypothetical protein [Paenibacillus polymyxa]|uniref:hypothetical protein n=1 Tax=Paenibacillus polymyxa TaxID=1406 RepID=UPI00046FB61E|nr:hypothetical protein [Paenibacillus polymyxa]
MVSNKKVHIEAEQLLQEAIICYKGSAYKASLLFSYLFFQTTLKYRILSNDLPNEINKSDLKELIDLVDKEDKWDKAVFDITNRKKEPSLFFKDYPEFICSIWFAPGELTEVRVVIALLRLKLIPSDQVEESIVRLIEYQAIVEPRDLLEEELEILTDNNFIELFKHYAFAKYEPFIRLFEWANYHKKNAII